MTKILRARTAGRQPRSVRFGQAKAGSFHGAPTLRAFAAARAAAASVISRTPIGKGAPGKG